MGEKKEETNENKREIPDGVVETKKKGVVIKTVTIIGQIEGHTNLPEDVKATKYEHIIPLLVAIEESPEIDGLLIILNTVGGDVEAGLAIAELIKGMKKPTASLILGGGHSIAIPIAVAAKKSFIVKSATMTVHPVRMNGLVIGVEQSFDYLRRMQERIDDFILESSRITKEDWVKFTTSTTSIINDIGSLINGKTAVDSGLIDAMGSLSEATEYLKKAVMKNREKPGSVARKATKKKPSAENSRKAKVKKV